MNHEQFVASLSSEQNAALLAFRDSLQAMYAQAAAETAEQHAQIVSELRANLQGAALLLSDAEATIADQTAALREKYENIERLNDEVNKLDIQRSMLDADLASKTSALENALARIHELENPPVIPTHISPATFRARFTNEQLLNIWDSPDPMAQLLVIKLCTTPYVDLASEEVIGGVHYISALRLISEDDIGRILAPA